MYIFVNFLASHGRLSQIITTVCVYVFANIMIVLYAPADTDTVPILIKKERRACKIKSIIWISIILLASFFIKDEVISNLCLFGILFQTLTITRFTYKIFGVKFGYLEYKKSL